MKYRILSGLFVPLMFSNGAGAANVLNFEGFGPVSRALGGAGVAHNIGAAGMMYNPATLGLMEEGAELYVGLDVVGTDVETVNEATGEKAESGKSSASKNRGPVYYAPQMAYTNDIGKLKLGVGAFALGGLGDEFGESSFLSRTATNNVDTGLGNSTRLLNFRIPFAAAYKVNDRLIVGGSVDAVWTALNLQLLLDASQVGALAGDGRVSGSLVPTLMSVPNLSGAHIDFTKDEIAGGGADGWGWGGKLGFTYQINDATRFGMSYSLETHVEDLSGDAVLTAIDANNNQIPLGGKIKIRDFQSPAQFSLGISHELSDQLTVLVDYNRVFWENVMKDIDISFVQDGTGGNIDILLPQNYKDINMYNIGAEYRYSQEWTFRAGFSHADSVLPNNYLLAVLPAQLQNHLTGGFSYFWSEHNTFEVALSYAFEKTMSNDSLPNTSVPIESSHRQLNAVLGYSYRF
ncbi:MAG: outer membrane protein transport protein [Pseudomonadota bacterium]|nr:outer membrane protein transport protein [Pseudomonadota bacterium]